MYSHKKLKTGFTRLSRKPWTNSYPSRAENSSNRLKSLSRRQPSNFREITDRKSPKSSRSSAYPRRSSIRSSVRDRDDLCARIAAYKSSLVGKCRYRIVWLTPAALAISFVVVPRNPFFEKRRKATSINCCLRSALGILRTVFLAGDSIGPFTFGGKLIKFRSSSFFWNVCKQLLTSAEITRTMS